MIDQPEVVLGQVRVRASAAQVQRLVEWAAAWPERTWAVEGARGMGYLLAQQLVAAGELVLDVQPKLGARVRLLATGKTNKNDPNDALSVAIAALRSTASALVRPDDHATVLKVWSKRHRDLSRSRAGRGVLRQPRHLPAVAAREPAPQPRRPHGRGHPDPPPAQPWPCLLRQENSRGQDAQYYPDWWPASTRLLIRRVLLDPAQVSADPRSRRRRTLHPDQRALPIPELASAGAIYAYSFIVTNLDVSTPDRAAAVEHWYRHRTTVENIFRDGKLGAALRHLPSPARRKHTHPANPAPIPGLSASPAPGILAIKIIYETCRVIRGIGSEESHVPSIQMITLPVPVCLDDMVILISQDIDRDAVVESVRYIFYRLLAVRSQGS